jgi:hypothetical protein
MFTSVFRILTATVVTGIALSPVAASASVLRPAALAESSANAPSAGDPDTTVTFTVTVGLLSMTAPTSANLTTGSGAPGTTISGPVGPVTVTDDRALLSAAWTVNASETNWTTGAGTLAEVIPATAATYNPGAFTTTGTITVAAASDPPIPLSQGAIPVVNGTAGVGNNTATWNPTIAVAIPAAAVGGLYTGTLTQSVS